MNKRWEIINKSTVDNPPTTAEELLEILLENRGIKTSKQKQEFLNPRGPEDYSPKELGVDEAHLQKAIKRIKEAVSKEDEIIVYGDYDADGICAAAIMWEALDKLHAKAIPYIPNRFDDGYGLNAKSIEKLKFKNPKIKLIITVDNGIVAFDAVNEADRMGIDVIITDHHSAKDEKPKAHATIHTIETSGSGVAYLLAQELVNRKHKNDNSSELAAIGTVADQLPLLGFNRSLVKYGLNSLKTTQRIGLRKLFATAGLLEKTIGTYEVNYVIAPRINASGRMADGIEALRLLCTRNMGRAEKLARDLDNLNLDRQKTVEEALKIAETSFNQTESSVIILSSEDYHEGVIGLIASRIVEKYYRPTIVLSIKGDVAKASARSISGFNIIDAIRYHENMIIEGGGHEMAAGFSINADNIPALTKKINDYAKPLLLDEVLDRKLNIDSEINFSLINQKVYNMLTKLEPHGTGNPASVFVSKNVKVVSQRFVGKESNHLKLVLEQDNKKVNAMMFNCPDEIESDYIDIVYRMNENTWNGKTSIELMLKDIKEL